LTTPSLSLVSTLIPPTTTQDVEREVINYIASTSNHSFMVGKELLKPLESDKNQQGVLSFGLHDEEEAVKAPTEEDPTPAAPEGGWGMRWVKPYLKVAECVREPKIKYFRTPKLGGYVSCPYQYSYEVDTMNEGDGPDIVDGACPPFPEFTVSTTTDKGTFSLDTLGTDGEFTDADCALAVEWTKKLSEGLTRVCNEKITAEREYRAEVTAANDTHWTELDAARKALDAELPGLLEESKLAAASERADLMPETPEGEDPVPTPEEPEAEKALREGVIKLQKLKERVITQIESITSLGARKDAEPRQLDALKAALLFMKTAPEDCVTWQQMKGYVSTGVFLVMFEKTDVSVARDVLTAQTAASVKAMIEGIATKNVERTHVPISNLLEWLNQAILVHDAAVEVRKAKQAAAEADGAAYDEKVEDTITDVAEEEAAAAPEADA